MRDSGHERLTINHGKKSCLSIHDKTFERKLKLLGEKNHYEHKEDSSMKLLLQVPAWAGSVLLSLLICTGCTIKATTDTATDGTTEFLSSTSGQAWWTQDGLVRDGQHAHAFVASNHDNLFTDIARGEGEYLHAFSIILKVTPIHQRRFTHVLQAHYAELQSATLGHADQSVDYVLHRIQSLRSNWEVIGVVHDGSEDLSDSLHPNL